MSKDPEMYVNDSKGYESEAKESFSKILEIFGSTSGWSQERLAGILKINSTTLRKYRREGTVSLYTTKRLNDLLGLDRDYFNGKMPITKDVEERMREKLASLSNEDIIDQIEKSVETKDFILLLRTKVVNANSYDEYSLEELEELKCLFENNLLMVTGRMQIVRVVENNKVEEK